MSTEITKNFEPAAYEAALYKEWNTKNLFSSVVDNTKKPFVIVIPPPNVTGVLHLGHTLNATIQDVLTRRAKMEGLNVCWVPGSDHASIATEAKVVEMLKTEKKINKRDLTREQFLEYAYQWKDKYGNLIYQQLEKLGVGVDWKRKTFTMDDHYYQAVIKVFIKLYHDKLIYKGYKIIHWDVMAQTALSDEEVEYKETQSQLHYLKYIILDDAGKPTQDFLTVATQRPETIMGDVALCVNPNDERYKKYHNKKCFIPIINKTIPIITDEYVDIAFGTGVLKITPAHDINDYNLGLKHQLPIVDILNDNGTISKQSSILVGEERFEARKKIIEMLKENNALLKSEHYITNIGYSQRTNSIVEPKLSKQWFLKTEVLCEKALKEVEEKRINIHPEERFMNTYKHWLSAPRDWCISRQLWWGQRIPVYYIDEEKFVVAENKNEAFKVLSKLYPNITIDKIYQDEDCLDTWFSSWIWPIEVFKGITQPNNAEFNYYYPTSVLVTGQDIIFFWVARMVMAGMILCDNKPFSQVYFTGMVRDKQGRKMSKSLGNSPDLFLLLEKYGADAVRFGTLISAPAGNDLLFDESSIEQGKNFNNKLWNAMKLMLSWKENVHHNATDQQNTFAIDYIDNKLKDLNNTIIKHYQAYNLNEILKSLYSFIWDDFCSDYLEWVKPKNKNIDEKTYLKTLAIYQHLLALLHPFMPFISEAIYKIIADDKDKNIIDYALPNTQQNVDAAIIQQGELIKKMITQIRETKNALQVPLKEPIIIYAAPSLAFLQKEFNLICQQCNATEIKMGIDKNNIDIKNIVVGTHPIGIELINKDKALQQIDKAKIQKELERLQQFKTGIENKLQNEKFINNASAEIIANEKKKIADTIEKIKALEVLLK